MTADISSEISGWATAVAAAIAAVALVAALRQVRGLNDQTALSAQVGVSQAYGQILQGLSGIHNLFLEHPDWIPYFYEGRPLRSDTSADQRARILHFCEVLMDFVDGLVEQRKVTPLSGMDWSTWEAYLRFFYSNSPVFREWVDDNIDFYPDYEFAVLGLVIVREPRLGNVLSRWHVRELDEENDVDRPMATALGLDSEVDRSLGSYPWLRTWVMDRLAPEPGTLAMAAVELTSPSHARVDVGWPADPPDDLTVDVLCSWVLGVLASSASIASATVFVHRPGGTSEATYGLRDRTDERRRRQESRQMKHLKPQEPFLVPTFAPLRQREHVRPPRRAPAPRAAEPDGA